MARFPYAAKMLAAQVREHYGRRPDSKAGLSTMEADGEPDGLGVYRTVKFDKTASKWLEPLIEALDDRRIISYETKGGHLLVTFSPRTLADDNTPFPLDAAAVVSESSDSDDSD